MNAIPYATTMGDKPAAGSRAENSSKSSVFSADETFEKCMPKIDDYDDEWTSFIEQHTMKSSWSEHVDVDDEAPPRVWNTPRV